MQPNNHILLNFFIHLMNTNTGRDEDAEILRQQKELLNTVRAVTGWSTERIATEVAASASTLQKAAHQKFSAGLTRSLQRLLKEGTAAPPRTSPVITLQDEPDPDGEAVFRAEYILEHGTEAERRLLLAVLQVLWDEMSDRIRAARKTTNYEREES
jgi:AraC-like DNA-binding protein